MSVKSIQVTSGYASKLPLVKDRKFEFSEDKINIIFGTNGCGKSSICKILAAYCSIKNGGWSRVVDNHDMVVVFEKIKFPDAFHRLSPGECKADVEWDGTPTFFLHMEAGQPAFFVDDASQSDDGISSYMDQIAVCVGKPSQGTLRLSKLLKLKKSLNEIPKLKISSKLYDEKNDKWSCNKEWQKLPSACYDYIKSLPRNGKPTVILDEPDRSLSIEAQILLWTTFIPYIATRFQVIVATHCFVPLISKLDFNFIEMEKDYLSKSRKMILECMQ